MAKQNFSKINVPPELQKLRKNAGLIAVVIIALVLVFTSWYTVGPEQAGVVFRLGKYSVTNGPGLHFKLPFGIDEVRLVDVERQEKVEFGFRTVKAGPRTQYSNGSFLNESLMLTGDLNLAKVEWVVQYRVNDPYKYLFKVRSPKETLKDIAQAVMREVVGDRTVNEVLTVGRQEAASVSETKMQELCNDYELGIKIEQIVLQDVNPPDDVKPSFNDVNEAQQEKERRINQARSDYNKVIPRASGQAQEVIQQAEGYKIDRVNRARGEVARFNSLYGEYVKAPEVTRQRIYLETMEKILPKLGNKIVTDEKGQSVLPFLQLQTNQKKGN